MIIDSNVGYGGPAAYYYDVQSVWVWSGGRVVTPSGAIAGPWRAVAGQVYCPGGVAGEVFVPGHASGEVFVPGHASGEVQ